MSDFGFFQAFHSWHGAIIISVLIVLSVYLTAVIVMRWLFFKKITIDSSQLLRNVHAALTTRDKKALEEFCKHKESDPPARIMVGVSLTYADMLPGEIAELLTVARMRQVQRLNHGLSVLSTLSTIAPFIGLLGTVIGIVESFNSLATTGASGPNVIAAGVAEALWATAAGLVVAIPAVVFHNIFRTKIKAINTDMVVVGKELAILGKAEAAPPKLRAL